MPEEVVSLRSELKALAASLQPFPTFLERGWIQAVEVALTGEPLLATMGCVVVCPNGELYELVLRLLPGPEMVSDPEPVEELVPLDLSDTQYTTLARTAINTLLELMRKGGKMGEDTG